MSGTARDIALGTWLLTSTGGGSNSGYQDKFWLLSESKNDSTVRCQGARMEVVATQWQDVVSDPRYGSYVKEIEVKIPSFTQCNKNCTLRVIYSDEPVFWNIIETIMYPDNKKKN